VDPKRGLQDAVPTEYLLGYALNPDAFTELLAQVVPVLRERVPGPDITPDRLAKRDWWKGPRLFVVIDDYQMIGSPMSNPSAPLTEFAAQGAEIGLHIVIARHTGQAMRTMMSDQLARRMWDLSTPGLLFSCPREEGVFVGDTKPLTLPAGRAQAVLRRRPTMQIQVALDESAGKENNA
jgi:S-DNA-T family DNA segregation ATPase FtsK/SpoIIIE